MAHTRNTHFQEYEILFQKEKKNRQRQQQQRKIKLMSIDVYWLLLPESTINLTMHTQFVLWAPFMCTCVCMRVYVCICLFIRFLTHSLTRSFVRSCVCMYECMYISLICLCKRVCQSVGICVLVKMNWWVFVCVYQFRQSTIDYFVSFNEMRWYFLPSFWNNTIFAGASCFFFFWK